MTFSNVALQGLRVYDLRMTDTPQLEGGTWYETVVRIIEESERRSGIRFGPECSNGGGAGYSSRRPSNSQTILRLFQSVCRAAGLVR